MVSWVIKENIYWTLKDVYAAERDLFKVLRLVHIITKNGVPRTKICNFSRFTMGLIG